MTSEMKVTPETGMQPYNPNRRWKPVSPPATAGSTRVVFHCEATGEYAEVPARWNNGGFALFGNAPGRGIEYYTLTGPTGVDHQYEQFNGRLYAPAEFH